MQLWKFIFSYYVCSRFSGSVAQLDRATAF